MSVLIKVLLISLFYCSCCCTIIINAEEEHNEFFSTMKNSLQTRLRHNEMVTLSLPTSPFFIRIHPASSINYAFGVGLPTQTTMCIANADPSSSNSLYFESRPSSDPLTLLFTIRQSSSSSMYLCSSKVALFRSPLIWTTDAKILTSSGFIVDPFCIFAVRQISDAAGPGTYAKYILGALSAIDFTYKPVGVYKAPDSYADAVPITCLGLDLQLNGIPRCAGSAGIAGITGTSDSNSDCEFNFLK
jgi:hypothetical protein